MNISTNVTPSKSPSRRHDNLASTPSKRRSATTPPRKACRGYSPPPPLYQTPSNRNKKLATRNFSTPSSSVSNSAATTPSRTTTPNHKSSTFWTSDRFIPNRSHLRVDICRASVESAERNLSATFDKMSRQRICLRRQRENDGNNANGASNSNNNNNSPAAPSSPVVQDEQQLLEQQYNSVVADPTTPLQAEFRRRMRGALLNIPLDDDFGSGGLGRSGQFSAHSHSGLGMSASSSSWDNNPNPLLSSSSLENDPNIANISMGGSLEEDVSSIVYGSYPDEYSGDGSFGINASNTNGGSSSAGNECGISCSSSSRPGVHRMLSFQGTAMTRREDSFTSNYSGMSSSSSSILGGQGTIDDSAMSISSALSTPNKLRRHRSANATLPSTSCSSTASIHSMSSHSQSTSSMVYAQPPVIDPFSLDQLHVLHRAATSNNNSNNSHYSRGAAGRHNRIDSLFMAENRLRSVNKSIGRRIPKTPSRILDAPDLVDDYYLNLVSWGSNNTLAVALGQSVYLWEAASGNIRHLLMLKNDDDFVTSVSWATSQGNKNYIAVGTNHNEVQLWDAVAEKRLRSLDGHSARVGALSWNQHWLSSGGRDSQIIQHDVRSRNHIVSTYVGHTQEVCGLKWNDEGSTLASGGNENLLCLWDAAMSHRGNSHGYHRSNSNGNGDTITDPSNIGPRLQLTQHKAAVKALAWCPFHRGLLASGGGTADRTIKFWNTNSGAVLNSIDTGSQVCSLLWSKHQREICSSHGFSENQLILWKYPSMTKIQEFKGHTARVLHMDQSPDGGSVVSAAADETLRFWDVFGSPPNERKGNNLSMGNFCGSPMIR
mmetsp:Transcript_13874/g.29757  ORF Transcript_13874/g.29757 Transcript_13874/m.29757 type:complete len:828 (+) Transcript_13874:244-2727(+)